MLLRADGEAKSNLGNSRRLGSLTVPQEGSWSLTWPPGLSSPAVASAGCAGKRWRLRPTSIRDSGQFEPSVSEATADFHHTALM